MHGVLLGRSRFSGQLLGCSKEGRCSCLVMSDVLRLLAVKYGLPYRGKEELEDALPHLEEVETEVL